METTLKEFSRNVVLKHNIDYSEFGDVFVSHLELIPSKQQKVLSKASSENLLDNPDKGLELSAKYGFIEAFLFFKELGAKHFIGAIEAAAKNGHIEIIKLFKPNDFKNRTMHCAAAGGHFAIVDLLISWGANDFNGAMRSAAFEGNLAMVKYLRIRATDLDTPMTLAAGKGHLKVVKYLKREGARDFNTAMYYAALENHPDIVEKCLEWGVTETSMETTMMEIMKNKKRMISLLQA